MPPVMTQRVNRSAGGAMRAERQGALQVAAARAPSDRVVWVPNDRVASRPASSRSTTAPTTSHRRAVGLDAHRGRFTVAPPEPELAACQEAGQGLIEEPVQDLGVAAAFHLGHDLAHEEAAEFLAVLVFAGAVAVDLGGVGVEHGLHGGGQGALVAHLGQAPVGDDGGRGAVAFAGQGGGQDLLGQGAGQGSVADQLHQFGQPGRRRAPARTGRRRSPSGGP